MNKPWKGILLAAGLALIAGGAHAAPFTDSPAADDVFYQFMPIAWRDSDSDGGASGKRFGDFNGMTASLPYLQSLGVTAVWMTPIFPSRAYHGYAHGPINQVNPWFGAEADFTNFVGAAKKAGIKVYIDIVAYAISTDSAVFQSAYNNPASPYDTWLAFTNAQNTTYTGGSYTTWNGDTPSFISWDLRAAAARQQVIDWSKHWLDPHGDGSLRDGIAGYRCDHVLVNGDQSPDGLGYTLAGFWTPWKAALKAINPNVFTFVEQADWGSTGAEFLGVHDAAFTKPFLFAARSALSQENAAGLYSAMQTAVDAVNGAGQGTFLGTLGDHDVDRLASNIGASASHVGRSKAAAAVLVLQPFPPIIYFGDELGMTGVKATGSTDANDIPNREPFKWTAVNAGPPMTNYFVLNGQVYTNRHERDHDGKSVEEQTGVPGSLLETYRTLITLRKNNAALRRGGYASVPASSSTVWAFVRRYAPATGTGQTLLAAVNVGGTDASTTLDLSGFTLPAGGSPVSDAVSGQSLPAVTTANQKAYPLAVPHYGYRLLAVNLTPGTAAPPRVDGLDIPNSMAPADLALTQTTPTAHGDNAAELDQLFVKTQPDGLLVGITGNVPPDSTALALWLDTGPGGQNVVDTSAFVAPPYGLAQLTGTKFDAGFAPTHVYWANDYNGTLYVDHATLTDGVPATKSYLGSVAVNAHNGDLSGGQVADGTLAALDDTNTAGVTATSASGAATARTGFEFFLPYAALGLTNPQGRTIGIAAAIVLTDGTVTNQCLPGLGPNGVDLGVAPDLTAIPGAQYAAFTIPPAVLTTADALRALQIAAGLATETAADAARLDGTADGRIDTSDAAKALREAMGL